jgi:hypothetical protein
MGLCLCIGACVCLAATSIVAVYYCIDLTGESTVKKLVWANDEEVIDCESILIKK